MTKSLLDQPAPDAAEDDEPLDLRAGLAIVDAQRRAVRNATVDDRLLFAVWGLAWVVGYGARWWGATQDPGGPAEGVAAAVFGVCLVTALVVTLVHVLRATRGVRGVSRSTGAMYGWAWFLGFAAQGTIVGGLARAGADDVVLTTAANGIALLVVGLLYLAGGALWQEKPLYALGAWILVMTVVTSLVGLPAGYLVMAAGGGGGLLVGALVATWRRRAA